MEEEEQQISAKNYLRSNIDEYRRILQRRKQILQPENVEILKYMEAKKRALQYPVALAVEQAAEERGEELDKEWREVLTRQRKLETLPKNSFCPNYDLSTEGGVFVINVNAHGMHGENYSIIPKNIVVDFFTSEGGYCLKETQRMIRGEDDPVDTKDERDDIKSIFGKNRIVSQYTPGMIIRDLQIIMEDLPNEVVGILLKKDYDEMDKNKFSAKQTFVSEMFQSKIITEKIERNEPIYLSDLLKLLSELCIKFRIRMYTCRTYTPNQIWEEFHKPLLDCSIDGKKIFYEDDEHNHPRLKAGAVLGDSLEAFETDFTQEYVLHMAQRLHFDEHTNRILYNAKPTGGEEMCEVIKTFMSEIQRKKDQELALTLSVPQNTRYIMTHAFGFNKKRKSKSRRSRKARSKRRGSRKAKAKSKRSRKALSKSRRSRKTNTRNKRKSKRRRSRKPKSRRRKSRKTNTRIKRKSKKRRSRQVKPRGKK